MDSVFSEGEHPKVGMSNFMTEDHASGPPIRVVGARTHNLQQISVDIPHGKLTVVTGVSGSGKSSLVFDTIFAEGRRRFLSSISLRSRELLQAIDRPDVDLIDGLPPVLCVEQRTSGPRRRSTVAMAADLYDYLRLLYSRVGKLHCSQCGQPVRSQTRAEIVSQASRLFDQQKVLVLAPIVRGRTGAHQDIFSRIVKDGYVRARVDRETVDASSPPVLSKSEPHDIEIVVDRLIMKPAVQSRLEESVDLALQLGQGQCLLSHETPTGWQDQLFSSQLACAQCGISFPPLEPRVFSFSSAVGACATCEGLGSIASADGTETSCESCNGTRLGPLARSVLIAGTSITDFCGLTPTQALQCVDRFEKEFTAESGTEEAHQAAVRHLLPELKSRLRFLAEMGLDYLTLDRGAETLSAGELQRVRLTACLGAELTGVCYILDEPTAGLHSTDTHRLLKTLIQIRDAGNTVIVVEHDLDLIRAADFVIDLGPGAGIQGGQVLAAGTPDELTGNPASITGPYLGGDVQPRKSGRKAGRKNLPPKLESISGPTIKLTGATLHNLKNVTIEVPLGRIVCVTGPSGSGKSSLIMDTLVPAIRRSLGERIPVGGPFQELTGVESLSRLVRIDQSPIGRSARSSPATYSGLWDDVRKVFAKTKESRLRGYSAKNFSLNVPQARCARCAGRGVLDVDEKRLSDWQVRCPECDGKRFSSSTLSIRYRGRSVADVLEMSIAEASKFFENFSRLASLMTMFCELGLGYLKLGQSAATLSGGEAQRIKLGTELAKSKGTEGSALFVLDEPTSGLHVADVQQLINVLRQLVEQGHSILVVEHNPALIKDCDWQIEIGPEAGSNGGYLISSHS